jgi:hypothetical protein
MFEEYLRQFPNGKFSGLSKIYIKKLKCGDSHREKTLAEQTDKGQTLASLAPKEELKPPSEMSLANRCGTDVSLTCAKRGIKTRF